MQVVLYLVQHGEAKSKEQDPERHLTEKGVDETRKIAQYLSTKKVKPDIIIHSGKARAKQTAEIYAEYLNPEKGISEEKNLAPLDDPYFWAEKLKEQNSSIMIVGHLPYLSKLLSILTTGSSEIEIAQFRYSCCIAILKQNKNFQIKWFITPDII